MLENSKHFKTSKNFNSEVAKCVFLNQLKNFQDSGVEQIFIHTVVEKPKETVRLEFHFLFLWKSATVSISDGSQCAKYKPWIYLSGKTKQNFHIHGLA